MKLATMRDGSRDGRLVVVSNDLTQAVKADGIAASLRNALERWDEVEPKLKALAARLAVGTAEGSFAFGEQVMAPLPRAWQWLDCGTYRSHYALAAKVHNFELPPVETYIIYQGVSDVFFGPVEDIRFISEADGIDFEGELAVVVDDVPMGATAADAAKHIKLLVQVNDWSLRELGRMERKIALGWLQSKPPCSMAPVAVTPDELGSAWRSGRPDITLQIDWNGKRFGAANSYPMHFSFPELIAYIAKRRPLSAGTVIGGGTVSNENYREVGSSCILERRSIELMDAGVIKTDYMKFGDTVRMEAFAADGKSVFGAQKSKVVKA